jgi:DNA repair exonuclease SbcCD ATPase subunit
MSNNAPNHGPGDDDVHPITQVPLSDNEEEVQEFPVTLFDGVLTQDDDDGEKSGGSDGSPEVAVVGVSEPIVAPPPPRRTRSVLPAEERRRRELESLEKKRLNRKIKALEAKIEKLSKQKVDVTAEFKTAKAELVRQKRTNKALSARLILMERKAEELEEQVDFQEEKSKEADSKTDSLKKRIQKMKESGAVELGDMSPKVLLGRLTKATTQLDLWKKENAKIVAEKEKLARQLESLQGRFEVVKANLEIQKAANDVKKMQLKKEFEELAMQRESRRVDDKIRLEKEKAALEVKKMEAKFVASEAAHEAKSTRRVAEAHEKTEAIAKRRKASYFGSNMVSCHVFFLCFFCENLKNHFLR